LVEAHINDTTVNVVSPERVEDGAGNETKGFSPLGRRERELRNQRKAMLSRHGVIPEYIKISEIY